VNHAIAADESSAFVAHRDPNLALFWQNWQREKLMPIKATDLIAFTVLVPSSTQVTD
jgi:hypothetical protein